MITIRINLYSIIFLLVVLSFPKKIIAQEPHPLAYADITIGSELQTRATRNYQRLESPDYFPERIFPIRKAEEVQWPGDVEGRLILALTLQAQATHREPKYLKQIIELLPQRLNIKGYFGPVQKDTILEQQLSGHGWLLRGLCEYYLWKKDAKVKEYIHQIVKNLALPTRGLHATYPINPADRKQDVGGASGTTQSAVGKWKLSSDIGCDFIFLDGVVQAYQLFPSIELQSLIDEMIRRFMQMNPAAIKAQTHATLTGLRGILRYYGIKKNKIYLNEVEKKYALYRSTAITANYENFNWFGRPEWTEPCAIIDSYLIAVQLWQFTGKSLYLQDAQLIYYNAIANTQRLNGGFGLDNCPVPGNNSLRVNTDEAWWCCTMRGAEGLAKAMIFSYFTEGKDIVLPFYQTSTATFNQHRHKFVLKQTTEYPFKGEVSIEATAANNTFIQQFKMIIPSWTTNHKLFINGQETMFTKRLGFLSFKTKLYKGMRVQLFFKIRDYTSALPNRTSARTGFYSIMHGPLVLGYSTTHKPEINLPEHSPLYRIGRRKWGIKGSDYLLTPVYHLLDSNVRIQSGYSKQIIFHINQN